MDIPYEVWSLRRLLNEITETQHIAVINNRENSPYEPTEFMYMFSFFNTLYNFDWEHSIEQNELFFYEGKIYEIDQIAKMLKFCFNNNTIDAEFIDAFIDEVCTDCSPEDVYDIMYDFWFDSSPKGYFNHYKKTLVLNLRNLVKDVFLRKKFTFDNLMALMEVVYGVRCNIFHGTKTFEMMQEPDQRDRLLIYTRLLKAVCEMVLDTAYSLTYKDIPGGEY